MSGYDPLKALQDAGIPLDRVSETEREVLKELTPEEVAVVIKVRKRVEASHEVVGQSEVTGGVLL